MTNYLYDRKSIGIVLRYDAVGVRAAVIGIRETTDISVVGAW